MELTIEDILNINQGLVKLQESKQLLPPTLDYKLSRVLMKTGPVINLFNEKRLTYIKELGEIIQDKIVFKTKENEEIFKTKIDELVKIKEEIDIQPILLSYFDNIQIPFGFFKDLDKIIKDDMDS